MDAPDRIPPAKDGASLSVFAECTQIIYRGRAPRLLSHLPPAILALSIGWESEVRISTVFLASLLVLYVVIGIASSRSFNSRPTTEESARRGARALLIGVTALGVIYNLLFLNLERHGVSHALDYLLLILCLFSAGAVASYQYLRSVAIVFIAASVGPLALYCFFVRGGSDGQVMALLLCVFIFFMSNVSLGLHQEALERLTLTRELKAATEVAERVARIDELTGLSNRRAFFEAARSMLAWSRRHDRPLSVMMIDVDHFKMVNDRFGHAAGDAVLVALGETLRNTERASDICGRLGGEEFAVLLPETTAPAAIQAAERLREAIAAIRVPAADQMPITASVGVAERLASEDTLDSFINRADRALYEAKALGRNRTVADPGK